jgi:hypothetical protein
MAEQEKKIAKGKAIDRGDTEISELSDIRQRDIDLARRDWKAKVDPPESGLIEAEEEKPQ